MRQLRWSSRSIAAAFGLLSLLSACGSAEEATPTLTGGEIETQVVATFAAGLTSTALAMPSDTPTATDSPTATETGTPPVTTSPAPTSAGVQPTASCYGLTFVSDVTIPDNTNMTPGQTFKKTWRVRNSGSCDWLETFTLRFTGGEAMGGTSVAVGSVVKPGSEVNLSVDLKAPNAPGTYRGNWRMATASGTFFGDEIFVQIVVGGSTATVTATKAATSGPTSTATVTPAPSETPTETPPP